MRRTHPWWTRRGASGWLLAVGTIASISVAACRTGREEPTVGWENGDVAGLDSETMPRYTHRAFTQRERDLLREAFGVDEPSQLYLSDSTPNALLKFDSSPKRCATCYVDTYKVGFLSMRRAGETWKQFEQRMRGLHPRNFSAPAREIHYSLNLLDPDVRTAFVDLIDAGRRAGFRLSVVETYRSPEREAMLFAYGHGRTYTATSMHSYGRAVDIVVGDGRRRNSRTRAEWIRFRRFVLTQQGGRFRLIGTPEQTWDWPHVELPSPNVGFHSIEGALDFAGRCTSDSARAHAPTSRQLGGAASDPCVFVPNLPPRLLAGL